MRLSRFTVEFLKFAIAVAFGFTLRIMLEATNEASRRLKESSIGIGINGDDLSQINDQLREPYVPRSLDDVIEFTLVQKTRLMMSRSREIGWNLTRHRSKDVQDVLGQVLRHLNSNNKERYQLKRLINGLERIDPLRGKEYIFDLEVTESGSPQFFRMHAVRPFTDVHVTKKQLILTPNLPGSPASNPPLHVIISISSDDLTTYLSQLSSPFRAALFGRPLPTSTAQMPSLPLRLYLAVEAITPAMKEKIDAFNKEFYPQKPLELGVQLLAVGSKPSSLVSGISQLPSNVDDKALLVLAESGFDMDSGFLLRCRGTLLDDMMHAIYLPIPFAATVPRNKDSTTLDSATLKITDGFWDDSNFGVICMKKSTYKHVTSFDKNKDAPADLKNFAERLIASKIQMIRSVDPGLVTSYSSLDCASPKTLNKMPADKCKRLVKRQKEQQSTTV